MKDNKIQAVHLGDSEGTILKKNYPILDLVGEIERETLLIGTILKKNYPILDLVGEIERETLLTRQTILAILEKIDIIIFFKTPDILLGV